MNSRKLLEAVAELDEQRRVIDEALQYLKKALIALDGSDNASASVSIPRRLAPAGSSYVDDAVRAIEEAGRSLHVKELVEYIAKVRAERPARASVESSIIRHIAKTKDPKLVKVAPSTYGITQREVYNGPQISDQRIS